MKSNGIDKHAAEAVEFARLVNSISVRAEVSFDPMSAACIIGQLQLALRHPANAGPAAATARVVIDGLIDHLAHHCDDPQRLRQLLMRGYDAAFDVPCSGGGR